jgi:hypothetical protein
MMVTQDDMNLMVPKIEYDNLETEVGMSDARLNESSDTKDKKDLDDVDGEDAITNNTPRGGVNSSRTTKSHDND